MKALYFALLILASLLPGFLRRPVETLAKSLAPEYPIDRGE